jgi:glycosyltransferase involved in cell wall biosynthesis
MTNLSDEFLPKVWDCTERSTPFFSIVVPMYNVERYIYECLNSVFVQSFRAVELVVIDDGSSDESVSHCLALMDQGHEFILLGQRQSGPNAARNLALRHIIGEYVLFMDADDRLSPDALDLLYKEICRDPDSDVISFGYTFFDDETGRIRAGACPSRRRLINDDIFVEALTGRDFGGVCWNKCFRHSFLLRNNINFIPDKIHGRDLIFSRTAAFHAKEWRSIDVIIYESRFRSGSFSRNFGELNIRSAIDVANKHFEVFRDGSLRRNVLPELNYAIYRHLKYIILLGAFRANSYFEYKKYFQIVQESKVWSQIERKTACVCDRISDKTISILIKFPRLCWIVVRVLKRLNYEPY